MYGNNSIHSEELIYSNHLRDRIIERGISNKGIELTKKYGTEKVFEEEKVVSIDFQSCTIAAEDNIDLIPYYSLLIVVTRDNVIKTVYYNDRI